MSKPSQDTYYHSHVMVYAPQRRHAVSSFTLVNSTLVFVQYLYSPNFLILIARILIQSQIVNSHVTHPGRSLFGLGAMLTFMNVMAVGLHSIDFMTGMSGGRGVILDFVGQSTPASLERIVLLDVLIWLCQLVSLEVTYITAHAGNIPHSPSFPYPDYLLPPTYTSLAKADSASDDDEDDKAEDDVESGLKRRRRKGFESAFEELDGELDALWLNEEDGPGGRPRALSSSRLLSDGPDTRIREPPLIFSLSFFHMLFLMFALPSPNPPPAAFAGGTPNPTPPVTPGLETTSPQIRPRTLARVIETDIDSSRVQREMEEDNEDDGRTRRMPGDFSRADGQSQNG